MLGTLSFLTLESSSAHVDLLSVSVHGWCNLKQQEEVSEKVSGFSLLRIMHPIHSTIGSLPGGTELYSSRIGSCIYPGIVHPQISVSHFAIWPLIHGKGGKDYVDSSADHRELRKVPERSNLWTCHLLFSAQTFVALFALFEGLLGSTQLPFSFECTIALNMELFSFQCGKEV